MTCRVCGQHTKEYVVHGVRQRRFLFINYPQPQTTPLCHEHLLREFEKGFTTFPDRMVVFYPDLEDKRGSYTYGYLPLSEVRQRGIGQNLVENALRAIAGGCQRCAAPAQLAYFGKGVLQWQVVGKGFVNWHMPRIEEVQAEPEPLCRRCAWEAIEPSLRRFPEFADGLCQPHNGEGLLISLEV